MTKTFITLQVGYSWSRMYGKTAEYFTTIIINGNDIKSISHYGMYGSDERINRALTEKGYENKYIANDYGLITRKEAWKGFMSENEALEEIKKEIK
jgi:hypothetical protein